MARYIDANVLIKVLDAKADMAMGTPKKVFLSVQNMVNKIPPADVAPRAEWISVEERWPETDGYYLVWNKEQRKIEIRFFHRLPPHYPVETYPEIRAYFGNCADYKSITHWMPLPEPPKGGCHEKPTRPPRRGAGERKPIPPSDGGVVRTGAAEVAADRMVQVAGEDAQIRRC